MSDTNYTDPAPADNAAADAAPAEETLAPLHPSWDTAMEAIPEMIRGPLVAQIRKSDKEAQAAIESARAGSVDPEWRAFTDGAREAGISPQELTETYNAALAIREDPIAFARDLNTAINEGVTSGRFTAAQAASLKQEGAATIADAVNGDGEFGSLKSADTERMDALQARLDAQDSRQQEQFDQQSEQQVLAEAEQYAVAFFTDLDAQLGAAGYGNVTAETRAAVARIADSALNGDNTNTLTATAAIGHAINALRGFGQPAKAQVSPASPMPVGGGRGAPAAAPDAKFSAGRDGKKEREAAMMAEANRIFSE